MKPFQWEDPFDDMTDEELDKHFDELFEKQRSSVAVSLRIAPELLGRLKREATRADVPYQTFMKRLLEAGVSHLERAATRRVAVTKRKAGAKAKARA